MKRVRVRTSKAVSRQPRWSRWSLLAVAILVVVPTLALASRTKNYYKTKGHSSIMLGLGALFELDGNVVVDAGADDWSRVLGPNSPPLPGNQPPNGPSYDGGAPNSHLQFTTGAVHDEAFSPADNPSLVFGDDIFTGGSTGDLEDISQGQT